MNHCWLCACALEKQPSPAGFRTCRNPRFWNLRSRHVGTGRQAIRVAARILSRLASPQSQRILIKSGVEVYPPKHLLCVLKCIHQNIYYAAVGATHAHARTHAGAPRMRTHAAGVRMRALALFFLYPEKYTVWCSGVFQSKIPQQLNLEQTLILVLLRLCTVNCRI